jgi:methylase of polypeptide subunit release factors
MTVLDLGCGRATISVGIAEAVPLGRVVGVDIDPAGLIAARCDAALTGCGKTRCAKQICGLDHRETRRSCGSDG